MMKKTYEHTYKKNTQIKTSKQIILLEDLVMQNNLYQKTKT